MSFLGALLTAFGVAPDAAAARGGIGRCPRCATPLCLSAGALHDDICAARELIASGEVSRRAAAAAGAPLEA